MTAKERFDKELSILRVRQDVEAKCRFISGVLTEVSVKLIDQYTDLDCLDIKSKFDEYLGGLIQDYENYVQHLNPLPNEKS